jgi:hypothetical protein
MSSITVSSLVLGSLTVEVDGSDSTLALSVLGTAPATLSIELGTPGAQGNAATIAVGTTTTLSPGSAATVANVGTTSAAVFNFGIPSGLTGATGPGVPVGGTDGQVLAKIDATDYNTQWATAFALQVRNQVRNETGATLTKGTVVYVTGAAGNKVTVTKAQANGDATSAQTFAVLLENIPNNQNGYAVTSGLLENLDTSAFAAGTQLYLSPTTAGTYTSTKPSAPDHLVYVGVIERSHVNQGSMLVRIQNGYELEELHNVAIAGLANNDLLAYDSATTLWKNKTFGTLGLLTSATAASTYLAKASNLSDLASASTARTNLGLGTAATASSSQLVPAGGTTGQVLAKASGTNYDLTWTTASASVAWGAITGTLSSQTDLNTALGLKAPLASPALTGTPTAPTATAGTSTTQIATTAFVTAVDVLKAPLASPTFTGTVTIPAGASISGYLTTSSASSTYQTLSGMSSYLTTSSAASTYQTLSGMSSYLTTSAAASTYQPIGTYLTDAPSDGSYYVRKDGAWEALIIS